MEVRHLSKRRGLHRSLHLSWQFLSFVSCTQGSDEHNGGSLGSGVGRGTRALMACGDVETIYTLDPSSGNGGWEWPIYIGPFA